VRVLIAGGSGLVGSALVRSAPENIEIYSPSRSTLSLDNCLAVQEFLKVNNIDSVILAAAKVGGILANSRWQKDFLLDNLKIQNSVIEASLLAGVKNFIFLGSSCIYPTASDQPIKEDQILTGPLEPSNEGYALAKIAGIRLCEAISDEFGLNYFSLMPTNLYGLNDNYNYEFSHVPAALMRRFHEAVLNDSPKVEVWGTGNVLREFMSSEDLASACWHFLTLNHGEELINIGTGLEISIRDFSMLIGKITGFTGEIVFDDTKLSGAPRKVLDVTKAKSLGWSSSISLEIGLSRTYDWFKKAYSRGEFRGA